MLIAAIAPLHRSPSGHRELWQITDAQTSLPCVTTSLRICNRDQRNQSFQTGFDNQFHFHRRAILKRLSLATAILAFGIGVACAQSAKIGDIEIGHPWAPPANKLSNSAAYMRLVETGTVPDELVSASSPVATKVQLHVFDVENGVYGMHPVHGIEVTPGAATTILRPGGAHVMLEGLKQPLKAGESFPLYLTFKNAGKVQIEVPIEGSIAAAQASH
jgi:periplasmic copper chaperone A